MSNLSLHLTGYVPSLDVAIDIDNKEIKYQASREKIAVIAQPSANGEMIPSKIYQQVRKGYRRGRFFFWFRRKVMPLPLPALNVATSQYVNVAEN